jgi:hypothetical protein
VTARIVGIVLVCVGLVGVMISRRWVDHVLHREKERGTDPGQSRSTWVFYFRSHFALWVLLGVVLIFVKPRS